MILKKIVVASSLGILLFTGCVEQEEEMETIMVEAPDVSLLYDLEDRRTELFETQQYDELADMMSETMTYTHSSSTMDDKAAILEGLTSGSVTYVNFEHSDLSARFFSPDVGVIHGNSHIDLIIDGEEVMVPLRFSIIYVNYDGEWKMEMWHSTRLPEE